MLLQHTDSIREADEGVSAALLVSAQDEMERLRAALQVQPPRGAAQAPCSPTFSTFSDSAPAHAAATPHVRVGFAVQSAGDAPVRVTLAAGEAGPEGGRAEAQSDVARAAGALLKVAGQYNAACNKLVSLQAALQGALGAGDRSGAASAFVQPEASSPGAVAAAGATAAAPATTPGDAAPAVRDEAASAARDLLVRASAAPATRMCHFRRPQHRSTYTPFATTPHRRSNVAVFLPVCAARLGTRAPGEGCALCLTQQARCTGAAGAPRAAQGAPPGGYVCRGG